MNEIIACLKTRRSIRDFDTAKMPTEEVLNQIIEAGIYAPTGAGWQSPIIIAVTDKAVRDRLSKLNAQCLGITTDPFYGAPVVLVVLANRAYPTYVYDGSLVMGNLMNAAHALGVDSCWIHRAKEVFGSEDGKALLKSWGVEGDYEGIGHCVLGYRSASCPEPVAKPRKPDYVHYVK
ncbi:MAG: nitroreductase [Prevotellaceae bacterium]|nr:nitroreductase [Prevotellaceae bacterium]